MKRNTAAKILIFLMLFLLSAVLASCREASPENTRDGTYTGTNEADKTVSTDESTEVMDDHSIQGLIPHNGQKIKIACIGDSITYGQGATVQGTDSYPAQLRKLLGSDYQVGNFGRSASYLLAPDNPYNVKDEKLSYRNTNEYKNSLKFDADVVIIMLGVNDIRSMSCEEARNDVKEALTDLTKEYMALPTVQKVYIATSIKIVNAAVLEQLCDGVLQNIQLEVAKELDLPVIDVWGMTRDYFDVMMHYTADRVHPTTASYEPIAKAVYSVLTGTKYTPTIPERSDTGVVYLSAAGSETGKGSSPETALNNLAKAVGLLRDGGGTIVLCGPYSLTYETHLPHTSGVIKITSVYDGIDYAQSSGAKLGVAKNLYFNGNFILENMTVVSEVNASILVCNYNDVTFGDGITSTLASGITSYPLIVAGYNVAIGGVPVENISLHDDCSITVNSGSWVYIRCGNRRYNTPLPMGTIEKDAALTVTINGGTFTNSNGTNLLAATGMNSVDGTCTLIINGGTFNGNIYAVGRAGSNTSQTPAQMNGTAEIIINGGTFKGSILAVQDNTTKIGENAKYEIYLSDSMSDLKDKIRGFKTINIK